MAKTAKIKKKQATPHSRAARRAVSPSLNLTKTIAELPKDASDPTSAKHHVLTQSSGIQKAKKGNLKRSQRLRHQKGLERGADNMDKLELRRLKSLDKAKNVIERAKQWEDINGVATKKKSGKGTFEALEDEADDKEEREWVSDDDMDEEVTAGDAPSGETDAKKVEGAVVEPSVEDELL